MPYPDKTFDAFLFDMDGTILSSIAPVERVWADFARRYGLDPDAVTRNIHGTRARDLIGSLSIPGIDVDAEVERVTQAELHDLVGIVELPGAAAFLRSLPADRWAIVTSAFRPLAERRIAAAGLPLPEVLVAAEDVVNGKPAPDGFILAASRLGVPVDRCLVFEDAIPGIAAAEAAGATVAVVTATHRHGWRADLPDIDGYTGLLLTQGDNGSLLLDRRR